MKKIVLIFINVTRAPRTGGPDAWACQNQFFNIRAIKVCGNLADNKIEWVYRVKECTAARSC